LNGWQDLLRGPVEEYDVPGSHLRMLAEPAVDSVARILRIQLGKAATKKTS
jgi:thioesterase domain-containing protein